MAPTSLTNIFACGLLTDLVMNVASAHEMPVNFYQTIRCNIPQDSHCNIFLFGVLWSVSLVGCGDLFKWS
jgi:hypothetical protein